MISRLRLVAAFGVMLICAGVIIRIFMTGQYDRGQASTSAAVLVNFGTYCSTASENQTTIATKSAEIISTEIIAAAKTPAEMTSGDIEFPLDLNTATLEELIQLPGIGEVLAGNIIAYREANGGFQNRQQLLEVSGIGSARYEKIYDLVYIYNESEYAEPVEEMDPTTDEVHTEQGIPIVDINTASAEDFAKLPGVDIELGERIVALREEIGGYENILELLYVEGMTDSLYISLQKFIVCG